MADQQWSHGNIHPVQIDKEMKTKCCYSPSDAMRGQAVERMRKLITNAKKVAIGEHIVGERVLVAFE